MDSQLDYPQRATNIVHGASICGVKCPSCGSEAGHPVKDSRGFMTQIGRAIRRRRLCSECGFKFSTVEMSADEFNTLMAERERVRKMVSDLVISYAKFWGED